MADRNSIIAEDYVDYIIEYNGDREALIGFYPDEYINFINDRYAVVYVKKPEDYMEIFSRIEYNLFPKVFGLVDMSSMEAAGVINVRQENILGLSGQGTLIAIIDTGIDISDKVFLDTTGKTRILAAWDQTVEEAEENQSSAFFGYGQEYSREDIQNAIDKGEKILKDTNGHGTFITGIAAGSETEEFVGAAPEAGIIVVKLKPAKDNIRKLYGIPENSEAYAENDIMLGIAYVLRQVKEIRRPVSILIALGSNSGNHAGSGALASFIDDLGITKGIAISVAAGNEGTARHHFSGETPDDGYSVMEFNVSDRNSLTLEIWGSAPNIYSIAMEIPGGEYIERIPPRFDKSEVIRPLFGGGVIYVDYFLVEEQSGDELIMIRLINPADGLWKIRVYASGDTVKKYDAWLPISDFLSSGTVFTRPDPDKTLTNPSNANYPICVAAYNHTDGGLYINGSRGYTADNRIKPDICAPGVEVFGPGRYGGYVRLSGTSVAAAHSAGCAALIFQWNMRINPLKPINGNQIKQYFIRGAQRSDIRTYPNKEWGYGTLDLYNTFIRLRE